MLDYKFDFRPASQLKRYPPTGIDVLIAGGGLGGMFAALNCYRKGHNVRVLESAKGYDNNGTAPTLKTMTAPSAKSAA